MNIRFTYLLSLLSATLLAACSDPVDEYLNGEGTPTPLNVSISLSDAVQKVQSRAADNSFKAGDVLLAYFQHMQNDTDPIDADLAPALVEFKVTSNDMAEYDNNTMQTSNLEVQSIKIKGAGENKKQTDQTKLYWDDFSNSIKEETDLRTTGHGLRTLYGYCYNGGTPTTALEPTTGELGWTVNTDQETNGIQNNDLLWSHTGDKQLYVHATPTVGLTIHYYHAMSKVTIILKAGKGFDKDPFGGTSIELQNLNTKCTVDATKTTANEQITVLGESANITMAKSAETTTEEGKMTRTFEAIVVPNNVWTKGSSTSLAVIKNVDGNDYSIPVSESIIDQFRASQKYGAGDRVTLESGQNYKLVITLDKKPQTIVATITDWNDVSASGTGVIKFNADITSHDKNNSGFNNGDMITLWRGTSDKNNDLFDENSDHATIDPATTCTLNGTTWTNAPQIYWPNDSTKYYFRALTKKVGSNYVEFTGEDYNHDSKTDLMVYEGTDLLWATTAAHNGNVEGSTNNIVEYSKGAAINPRTGTVPMQFEHVMSKVTIKLETTDNAAKVDLSQAKVKFASYSIGGRVSLVDGSCSGNDITEGVGREITGPITSETTTTVVNGGFFLPQKLDEQSLTTKLTITLKDGTTYSLYLKDCNATDGGGNVIKDSEGNPTKVTQWERGKHYTYTIHLEKEKITFRALVKDWEEAKGSGNATLDWD